MALYHFSVKQVSRGKGQTVVNSAAYISGQKLYNDYYGQTHDYTKKSGVVFTEILTPEYVPERLSDRETLWNEVEQIEKSKRAQLAYSFDIALQNELTLDENIELAREFCWEQFVARGMIVDLAVHEGKSKNEDEPDNPHFHVLAPIRPFTEEGSWGNKQKREYVLDEDGNRIKDAKGKDIFNAVSTTGWNDPELLKEWRRAWTEKVNEKFRECHMAARIDHRSYKEQGIDLIPTIHEGYEVRAMEKKGIKTVIGELNRAIRQFNQMFISLKESIQWMKTAYEEMKAELDRRQNPTLLESLQDYYDKKTQGRPPLPNFYAEMKRRGKNLSNLQEFAKSINYLQTHKIETMEDLQERIDELNGVVSVSKKEISEKREQLKKLENLEKNLQDMVNDNIAARAISNPSNLSQLSINSYVIRTALDTLFGTNQDLSMAMFYSPNTNVMLSKDDGFTSAPREARSALMVGLKASFINTIQTGTVNTEDWFVLEYYGRIFLMRVVNNDGMYAACLFDLVDIIYQPQTIAFIKFFVQGYPG